MADITDLVENTPELAALIEELLQRRFLLPGVFHPRAYLVDDLKIDSAATKQALWINAAAVGVALHNQFFSEVARKALQGEDPSASEETSEAVARWEKRIAKNFPDDAEARISACRNIGQYLEFMNRKSQGF